MIFADVGKHPSHTNHPMARDEEATLEEALENLQEATRLLRVTLNLSRSSGMGDNLDYQDLNHRLLSAVAMTESAYAEARRRARGV
jgi:hypothetical protein